MGRRTRSSALSSRGSWPSGEMTCRCLRADLAAKDRRRGHRRPGRARSSPHGREHALAGRPDVAESDRPDRARLDEASPERLAHDAPELVMEIGLPREMSLLEFRVERGPHVCTPIQIAVVAAPANERRLTRVLTALASHGGEDVTLTVVPVGRWLVRAVPSELVHDQNVARLEQRDKFASAALSSCEPPEPRGRSRRRRSRARSPPQGRALARAKAGRA